MSEKTEKNHNILMVSYDFPMFFSGNRLFRQRKSKRQDKSRHLLDVDVNAKYTMARQGRERKRKSLHIGKYRNINA